MRGSTKTNVATTTAIATPPPSRCRGANLFRLGAATVGDCDPLPCPAAGLRLEPGWALLGRHGARAEEHRAQHRRCDGEERADGEGQVVAAGQRLQLALAA